MPSDEDESLPASASQWLKTAAVAAAILAFCIQPVLRFVDADLFMGGGAIFGAGLTGVVAAFYERGRVALVVWAVTAAAMMVVGGWLLGTAATQAGRNAVDNDARCLAIQRDMLSAHRRMQDAPDVFQALGCRPQGAGVVHVPPTDREHRAGAPLPDGGYPNR